MFDDPSMPWRLNRSVLAAGFLALLALAALCDTSFATAAASLPPAVESVGLFVTTFGLSGYMFLITAVIAAGALWLRGRTQDRRRQAGLTLVAERAIYVFAAIAASGILVQIIKHIVGRNRPKLLFEVGAFHFDPFSTRNVYASFPSGHTTTAFAAAVALTFIAPSARRFWLFAAICIGVSRIIVRAHYPSDVVAGAGLGAATAYALARIFAARSIAFDPASPVLRMKPMMRGRIS